MATLLAGVVLPPVLGQSAPDRPDSHRCTVFTDAAVIDVDHGQATPNQAVLVCGDRITAVGTEQRQDVPPDAVRLPLPGRFLVPGLVDMHVHLRRDPPTRAAQYLRAGITTVRDMNGRPEVLALRRAVREGTAVGPTIYSASPTIGNWSSPKEGFPTPVDAREAADRVRQFQQDGYDFIKVYTFIPRAPFLGILNEARARRIPVVGHVPSAITVGEALAGGMASIEHLTGYVDAAMTDAARQLDAKDFRAIFHAGELDPVRLRALVEDTVASSVANCPTIVWFDRNLPAPMAADAWKDSALRAEGARNRRLIVRELARAGAILLAGSDSGENLPPDALHDELAALVESGLSPGDVLRMATISPAAFLGGDREFGRITEGLRADLLVLTCNPLESVSCLRSPERIVVRGKFLDEERARR